MKILLIIALLTFPFKMFSQINGIYKTDICNNISCYLSFANNYYCIELFNTYDDQETIFLYSQGTYTLIENRIILNSNRNDSIILKTTSDFIVTINSPLFLENHIFEYISEENYDSKKFYSTRIIDTSTTYIIDSFINCNSDSLYHFKKIRYWLGYGLDLNIINDNEYEINLNCMKLSFGRYKRKGNAIIFYYNNKEYFYALIDKDNITFKLFPWIEKQDIIIPKS